MSFRTLASKIHPPLPLTARESTQLLNVLTASFQHHLDQHHPVGAALLGRTPPTTRQSTSPSPRSLHFQQLHAQASANDHIGAVLANPLLARKPRAVSFSSLNASSATDAQLFREKPLEWLEEKIATGTVSMPHVAMCLDRLWQVTDAVQMKELGAASKIVGWLRASSQIPEADLLSPVKGNKKMYALLTNMLVLEGREEIIVSWLKSGSLPHGSRSRLLNRYLHAASELGSGLESAMTAVLRLSAVYKVDLKPLQPAMWGFIFLALNHGASSVSAETYDSFSARSKSWSRFQVRDEAFLSLFHPSSPSPEAALRYLKSLSTSGSEMKDFRAAARYGHVTLSLALTQLLLAQDRHEDAKFVLQFAQKHFPHELGLEDITVAEKKRIKRPSEPSADEVANLQQLDGLLVG
jgi:hypothetical protein